MNREEFGELRESLTPLSSRSTMSARSIFFCKTFSLATAATLLLTGSLMAEEIKTIEGEVPLMDRVVVTATRQEEKISTIPANITVISEQDIARSTAETVPDLLRGIPGVLVNDITGNGRSVTVDLRGFGETAGPNTLVLIDGRRINNPDLSSMDWTLIPKNRVQRIEIVRGSRGSVFYGDNAAGGVVNIITKKGGEETKISGNLAVGSFDTLNSSATASGSGEHLSYALNANYFTSDGYRDNSETEAKDVGLNLDFFAGDQITLNLSGGYHEDETNLPGGITETDFANGVSRTESLHPDDYLKGEDYYGQAVPEFFFTDDSFVKIEASTRKRTNDSFISFSGGNSLYTTDLDTVAVSPQIVLNEKIFGHTSKLTIGFDYSDSTLKINNKAESIWFGSSTLSEQATKENLAYYVHEEFPVTDKLIISGGARYDKVTLGFPANSSPNEAKIDEESYTAGVTYRLSQDLSTFVSYSTSFRYPLLDEIFDFFSNTFNTTLTSQTGDDYEAGFLWQPAPNTTMGVNVFRIETENEIFYNPKGGAFGFGANENLDGETLRQGVEITASKKISSLLLSGSYSYKDSKIEGGTFDGKEVPNVPTHQATLAAEIEPCTNVIINLNGSYIGERVFISDFTNSHTDQEDYFSLNGKLTYMLEKGSMYITVNNILNEKYSEYSSITWDDKKGFYPSPEINVMTGLKLEF